MIRNSNCGEIKRKKIWRQNKAVIVFWGDNLCGISYKKKRGKGRQRYKDIDRHTCTKILENLIIVSIYNKFYTCTDIDKPNTKI